MITLYGFGPALGLPDPSPFVMKAEMLLKLANLPYRIETGGMRRAPKGKLPYIDDAGTVVGDSTFIRWHIESRHHVDFDRGLSDVERGIAWSIEKMLEDHLYWAAVDARWCDDDNFEAGIGRFFNRIPQPLRAVAKSVMRRKVRRSLHAHGMGRHARHEIEALAVRDLDALAAILGNRPYLMGDRPCGADATVFAFVAGMLSPYIDTPIRTAAEHHVNLVGYSARMMRQYYPALAQPHLSKAA